MSPPNPLQIAEDVMRVSIRDLDGHLVRILDLNIGQDVVLQAGTWFPGVKVPEDERDLEAEIVCGLINESGFALDADGVPVGVSGDLHDDDENPTARWQAERVPKNTPRPSIDEWQGPSSGV
jgi:hypothetical protein